MSTDVYALIGDLVGSRTTPSRRGAHDAVQRASAVVNDLLRPLQPVTPTVGDEFQGLFATLAEATLASLTMRVELEPVIGTRYGIGRGVYQIVDDAVAPPIQDGSAWWAARAAIDGLSEPARKRWHTWVAVADGLPDPGVANAYLTVRDQLVDRLNERGTRMLAMALRGESQRAIAAAENISESAVSQQFARGIHAIVEAERLFGEANR